MIIGIVQFKSLVGEIATNLDRHITIIKSIPQPVDLIVFPELSLTGYEPKLAEELAMDADDRRFDLFQDLGLQSTICIGFPLKTTGKPQIGMKIFEPGGNSEIYTKEFLHDDELTFFRPGSDQNLDLKVGFENIRPAICYELSVERHRERAIKNNASFYMVSAAKTESDIDRSIRILKKYTQENKITVCISNALGKADGVLMGGKSSIIHDGKVISQIDEEGVIVYDSQTKNSTKIELS